ncbi:DUF6318 family protein [Rothia mucilaginosa]|uniref:DUF6318 family protein n=1 Tax=Rothia mucilaginosa TaxID=43675 RepID=UPI0034D3D014
MTSVILTRRAMLSGSAMLGIGTLLAACSQQANNEASVSASSTAAPSETASTVVSESVSASASTTPKPVVTRGYSGNSKAPDGEYRKADGYGPAQNVPKPRNEPAQYPETEEGLAKMMQDWDVAHNYGIQTGDCSYAKKYVSEDTEEYKFYEYIEALYQRGGWVIEGLDSYQKEGDLFYNQESKEYRVKTRRVWTTVLYFEPDGTGYDAMNKDTSDDAFIFVYRYSDGFWKIIASEDLPANS